MWDDIGESLGKVLMYQLVRKRFFCAKILWGGGERAGVLIVIQML